MRHWINQHATDIVAVSGATMAAAWSPSWDRDPRCRVIYTAIDVEPFRGEIDRTAVLNEFGLPDTAKIVIHVGSQQEAKNHHRLIGIFAAIFRRDQNTRLLLVGRPDPTVEQRIRERAAELGILAQVIFAGERTDVPRLLKAADVMVFPSIREGLPGAVLEACAAGLPVVATDLPFMHEIAAQVPNVRCVSLDAGDEEWARAADALEREPLPVTMERTSPASGSRLFRMDHYAHEWRQVWERDSTCSSRLGNSANSSDRSAV